MEQTKLEQQVRMITNPRELIQDVGEWAKSQPWHPNHAPDYGVVEEIGELAHAVLKHLQGIRGFENVDFFRVKVLDALGDIMVFLSHWCFIKEAHFITKPEVVVPASIEMRDCMEQLLVGACQMLALNRNSGAAPEVCTTCASRIAQGCQYIAKMFGWDLLDDCLYPTWHRVRLRNFHANPTDGGASDIEAEHGLPATAPKELGETSVDVAQIEGEKPIGHQ